MNADDAMNNPGANDKTSGLEDMRPADLQPFPLRPSANIYRNVSVEVHGFKSAEHLFSVSEQSSLNSEYDRKLQWNEKVAKMLVDMVRGLMKDGRFRLIDKHNYFELPTTKRSNITGMADNVLKANRTNLCQALKMYLKDVAETERDSAIATFFNNYFEDLGDSEKATVGSAEDCIRAYKNYLDSIIADEKLRGSTPMYTYANRRVTDMGRIPRGNKSDLDQCPPLTMAIQQVLLVAVAPGGLNTYESAVTLPSTTMTDTYYAFQASEQLGKIWANKSTKHIFKESKQTIGSAYQATSVKLTLAARVSSAVAAMNLLHKFRGANEANAPIMSQQCQAKSFWIRLYRKVRKLPISVGSHDVEDVDTQQEVLGFNSGDPIADLQNATVTPTNEAFFSCDPLQFYLKCVIQYLTEQLLDKKMALLTFQNDMKENKEMFTASGIMKIERPFDVRSTPYYLFFPTQLHCDKLFVRQFISDDNDGQGFVIKDTDYIKTKVGVHHGKHAVRIFRNAKKYSFP